MPKTLAVAAALAAAAFAVPLPAARAAQPAPAHEPIEWLDVWLDRADLRDHPQVLLIGDSITRGYYPVVNRLLAGKAHVSRLCGSRCVGDPQLLDQIHLVLAHHRFDVIHFNNGMHGWDDSDAFYAEHFPEYLAAIRQWSGSARLIWATTTPVRVVGHWDAFSPLTPRVRVRNAAAARWIDAAGIPTDDLFTLVLPHPEYWKRGPGGGGVHYTAQGYAALGGQVARFIEPALPTAPAESR